MKKIKTKTTKFENIRIADCDGPETLEERDRRICEEEGEPYKPSEITKIVMHYIDDTKVRTDFESLLNLAKELEREYGYSLIIEPKGMLLIYIW